MCIRDRTGAEGDGAIIEGDERGDGEVARNDIAAPGRLVKRCLLYTSDAADERSSVDLGGRRIIKKKKNRQVCGSRLYATQNKKQQG